MDWMAWQMKSEPDGRPCNAGSAHFAPCLLHAMSLRIFLDDRICMRFLRERWRVPPMCFAVQVTSNFCAIDCEAQAQGRMQL
jgi:hypothetical protein